MGLLTQVETLLPELRAYARAICGSPDAAEDLVQDSIERLLKAQNVPNRISRLRPWMFRVIRNLHYDELRRMRVRREYIASQVRLNGQSGVRDHAGDILFRLGYERLPEERREILFLIDIMGLKYSEAAEVMGVQIGTVMSRISRARQALRDLVEGEVEPGSAELKRRSK